MSRIHGLGNFELVSYNLVENDDGADLTIDARAKSWGPDYLHLGIVAESEFEHESRVSLLLGYTRQEVNEFGAEWHSVATLGDEPAISTHWYQPLSVTLTVSMTKVPLTDSVGSSSLNHLPYIKGLTSASH